MAGRALIKADKWRKGYGLMVASRAASGVSKDVLPGPYPKTPEERAAAAKKYNMMLEDYQPYPDDGRGYGDYPMLPNRSSRRETPGINGTTQT
ncbi:hypothetical protein SRHO_G00154550 [Serrasalmus rhombeus]